jgi:hypothetical protein
MEIDIDAAIIEVHDPVFREAGARIKPAFAVPVVLQRRIRDLDDQESRCRVSIPKSDCQVRRDPGGNPNLIMDTLGRPVVCWTPLNR